MKKLVSCALAITMLWISALSLYGGQLSKAFGISTLSVVAVPPILVALLLIVVNSFYPNPNQPSPPTHTSSTKNSRVKEKTVFSLFWGLVKITRERQLLDLLVHCMLGTPASGVAVLIHATAKKIFRESSTHKPKTEPDTQTTSLTTAAAELASSIEAELLRSARIKSVSMDTNSLGSIVICGTGGAGKTTVVELLKAYESVESIRKNYKKELTNNANELLKRYESAYETINSIDYFARKTGAINALCELDIRVVTRGVAIERTVTTVNCLEESVENAPMLFRILETRQKVGLNSTNIKKLLLTGISNDVILETGDLAPIRRETLTQQSLSGRVTPEKHTSMSARISNNGRHDLRPARVYTPRLGDVPQENENNHKNINNKASSNNFDFLACNSIDRASSQSILN